MVLTHDGPEIKIRLRGREHIRIHDQIPAVLSEEQQKIFQVSVPSRPHTGTKEKRLCYHAGSDTTVLLMLAQDHQGAIMAPTVDADELKDIPFIIIREEKFLPADTGIRSQYHQREHHPVTGSQPVRTGAEPAFNPFSQITG